ncbi:MAG: ATP-binding protein [Thermostichales cyanobacterium DRC_bins_46]
MLVLAEPRTCISWKSLSFPSTLNVSPFLDELIRPVPRLWQPEVRLGLHEVMINAARHGNRLDPRKHVIIYYSMQGQTYHWIVRDQGSGFPCQAHRQRCCSRDIPEDHESGRGVYLILQIFDHVEWNDCGNQVYLRKTLGHRPPLIC